LLKISITFAQKFYVDMGRTKAVNRIRVAALIRTPKKKIEAENADY
jgi:hypothetical protein